MVVREPPPCTTAAALLLELVPRGRPQAVARHKTMMVSCTTSQPTEGQAPPEVFFSRCPSVLMLHPTKKTEKNKKSKEMPKKAPDVENFAWLPVGVNSDKSARGSVSLI